LILIVYGTTLNTEF